MAFERNENCKIKISQIIFLKNVPMGTFFFYRITTNDQHLKITPFH